MTLRNSLPWREAGWSAVFVAFVSLGVAGLLPPKVSELAEPARHAGKEGLQRQLRDLFALSFRAAVQQSPVEEIKAPHVGWVQSVLVEPGQRVAEGEPLLRLWQQPPPGEGSLPAQVTEALTAVEKVEKEKSAAKAALGQSVERLQELRAGVEEARAKLSAARTTLNEALTVVTRKAEKAAADAVAHGEQVRTWQAERDRAEAELAAAKRATDEASRALEACKGKLPEAQQEEKAAREELAKRQRLFELGVIAEVDVRATKLAHTQAQTALTAAKAATAQCERVLQSAKGAQDKAEARQKALPPAPQRTNTDTSTDFTEYEHEVAAARAEATQLQGKLDAEIGRSEKLREALQNAEARLDEANERWKQAQVEAALPSGDLLTTVTAPADLTVEEVVAGVRSRVDPETTLVAYRPGDGWQIAFNVLAAYRDQLKPGAGCRVRLLVKDAAALEATVVRVEAAGPASLRVIARFSQTAGLSEPCEATVRFDKSAPVANRLDTPAGASRPQEGGTRSLAEPGPEPSVPAVPRAVATGRR
jgi:multidrug resistance efflux pump